MTSAAPKTAETKEAPPQASQRLVAIGDLHGDLDNAIAVLRLAGLADEAGHWSGGNSTLVQTGDTIDRGPDSKAVMDLMDRLGTEAQAAGGRVISLLGNHEVMNLYGDLRYVAPGDFDAFGGPEARAAAFAPDGSYGASLSDKDIVAKVESSIFVHGGVTPHYARKGLDGINQAAREAMRTRTPSDVLEGDGPLWYRGFVQRPEPAACATLGQSLTALDAERMVVGHTTQASGRILSRCGGRLLVIDIGISDHYGAHLGALELTNGDAKALYPEGPVDLEDPA